MPTPPNDRPLTNRAAAGVATPEPRRATRLPPAAPRRRGKRSLPGAHRQASATARGLALVALALAAGVIAGVVTVGRPSASRQAQTEFRTVTATKPTRVITVTRSPPAPGAEPAQP